MKRFKFLNLLVPIFVVALLAGCDSDERAPYIEALENANQTTLSSLEDWFIENEERIDELFEIDEIHVDLDGTELQWSQVSGFADEFFEAWSFEVDGEYLTFTFTWDYEAATANPFAAENLIIVEWFDVVIEMMEDIDVENSMLFLATLGGFISGTTNALDDPSITAYFRIPIEGTLDFLQEVHDIILQEFDDPTLDLAEIRDIVIDTLQGMRAIYAD